MREKKVIEEGQQRVVDRLRYILFDMNKSETEMSRECGIPMGVISNAKRPGYDLSELQVRRILAKYPFINPPWLLRGEGERYRDVRPASAAQCDAQTVEAMARNQARMVEHLMKQNKELLAQVESLTEMLGMAMRAEMNGRIPPQRANP